MRRIAEIVRSLNPQHTTMFAGFPVPCAPLSPEALVTALMAARNACTQKTAKMAWKISAIREGFQSRLHRADFCIAGPIYPLFTQ